MAEQKKVIYWTSDLGKVDGIPANGKLKSARAALESAHAFMAPFVRKLSMNTGDARIVLGIEYIEKGREPAAIPSVREQAAQFNIKSTAMHSTEPFMPAANARVRHTTDLPCPKCNAASGVMCDPTGADVVTVGNGIVREDAIKVHGERAQLFVLFVKLLSY
jgi:hypothetical protein